MNPIFGITIIAGTIIAALFNYFLNRAPGSDPEDFQIGPKEMGIKCDCFFNTLIVGAIAALAIAASSSGFDSMEDFFIVAFIFFAVITDAGILGRRQRYRDWNEMSYVLKRAVSPRKGFYPGPVDILFDENEDE